MSETNQSYVTESRLRDEKDYRIKNIQNLNSYYKLGIIVSLSVSLDTRYDN